MAIGALSKINNNPRNNLDPGLRDLSSKDQSASYAFALRQYDKALSLMRKAIAEGEHDLRRALIACVLVFCFETLQGNQASAVMHAQSGLLLLMQRVVAHKVPFKPSPLLQERDVMEEDFMNAFQSLDLQVLFFPDRRPACTHHCAIAMCNKFIALLPAELHTIEGARSEWIIIMRRNYHFHTIALVVGKARGLGGPWNTQPLNDSSANMIPGENVFATVKEPPDELLDDQLRYREDIRSWSRACSSLFERVNRFGTMQERAVATILKMNALMNNIMLAGLFFSTETEYDIFLPEFRAIVGMVEFLILGDGPTLLYHFDLGMLVALFLVGLRCRDRETRGRAIDLMEANLNSRQGIWDVRINALVTSWIRDVEEESMDEYGNIPEEKRAIVTGADIDILGKRVVMTCTHRTKQGLIFRYKSVAW